MGRKKRRHKAQRRSKLAAGARFRLRCGKGHDRGRSRNPRLLVMEEQSRIDLKHYQTTLVIEDGHPLSPYRAAM
jgi:hypothetical protein